MLHDTRNGVKKDTFPAKVSSFHILSSGEKLVGSTRTFTAQPAPSQGRPSGKVQARMMESSGDSVGFFGEFLLVTGRFSHGTPWETCGKNRGKPMTPMEDKDSQHSEKKTLEFESHHGVPRNMFEEMLLGESTNARQKGMYMIYIIPQSGTTNHGTCKAFFEVFEKSSPARGS